jgi:hypothetical protein
LNAGDVLSTGDGRAEILLTPGVYMRVGKNSAVRMVTPELTNTRVEVLQGQAMVEADFLHPEDRILVSERGATAAIEKKGVYDFNAQTGDVKVYDGKAELTQGDQHIDLKKGRETILTASLKAQKFDRDASLAADPLYNWSKLRSEYLADATASTARTYIVEGGGWYGPGWYWNPWWGMYSFVPGGFFYTPFGFGLYSPVYFYGGVHYPGFRGPAYAGRAFAGRSFAARGAAPAFRSAPMAGGFHGGFVGGFRGGR